MCSATDLVYEQLREAIIYGECPPGMALGEVELSARYNVSRTPVREALKRLAGEGLVSKRKRGLAVKSYSPTAVRDVYDLRALLEGYAAALAAEQTNTEQLELMRIHNAKYEAAVGKVIELMGKEGHAGRIKTVIEANAQFHDAIVDCAGNSQLAHLASNVMVLPLVFRSFYWGDENALLASCRAHRVIIEAIEGGDTGRAKSAMCEHIYVGRDFVISRLETTDMHAQHAESY